MKGSGRFSVRQRLLWLERRAHDLQRPGCAQCRDGFGLRLFILQHDEEPPPWDERCRGCGRKLGQDEGVRMLIQGMAPDTLRRLETERNAQLEAMAAGRNTTGGPPWAPA